ncbi:cell wall-active antibiotics response protein [Yinghuangia sp. ASG 101]|uniref:PspC domain-containing protein n=1 Tax=Yinghuangia sp. ASG 101 TaxID=2896848 RepID=UPI001E58951D|nr:PspC domain-containing protein [Yinghuangia sp. ASG 101]UGQ14555.1 cell wall-active antibiotics response protein [Yinghuangia sp. ASG 101]
MNDTTSPGPEAPPPADGSAQDDGIPLIRTADDRVVAGVGGGLGRHFGVDPVVFRVVFAVLTLFGGLGILLYGLGWLLMPADDQPTPLARDLLSGRSVAAAIPALAVAGIGTGVFFSYLDNGFDGAFPLLIVAAVILYVSHNSTRRGLKARRLEPTSLNGTRAANATPSAAATGPAAEQARPRVSEPTSAPWWRRTPAADDRPSPPPPPRPEPRKGRYYLAPATISLAAIAGGAMWWLDETTSDDAVSTNIPVQVFLSVILAILAAGLLVGTFIGGGRWLILPALATAALVSASAALTVPLTGPSGERTYAPGTVAAVESSYRHKFGELKLDLTKLDFAGRDPADPVRIKATVGVGQLTVRVPDDVRVIVDADADLGSIDLQDRSDSGYKPERKTVITPPADRPTRATISLDLAVGVGNLEVKYAG